MNDEIRVSARLTILIQETDLFFQAGLEYFFEDFFAHNFHCAIRFCIDLTHDNVSQADVIVLALCQGETLTCFPELQARQKGIILGLVDDERHFPALPSCYQDIIFLPRRASLDRISGVLYLAWSKTQLPGYSWNKKTCFECQHKFLSPQQIRVMVSFHKGLSVTQTASLLKMSDKTVYAHKYLIMQKFNLRSDYELIVLLRKLMKK